MSLESFVKVLNPFFLEPFEIRVFIVYPITHELLNCGNKFGFGCNIEFTPPVDRIESEDCYPRPSFELLFLSSFLLPSNFNEFVEEVIGVLHRGIYIACALLAHYKPIGDSPESL
jgi:hypothetical protein